MDQLIKKIKEGQDVDLTNLNLTIPQVADADCNEDELLIDLDLLSKQVLKSSDIELITLYKCLRDNDEFWERVEVSYHDFDPIALKLLRLVSVLYEKSIGSSLAYDSVLYRNTQLEISLESLVRAILKQLDKPDIVRSLLEIYTLKRREYRSVVKGKTPLEKSLYALDPPEIVWSLYLEGKD